MGLPTASIPLRSLRTVAWATGLLTLTLITAVATLRLGMLVAGRAEHLPFVALYLATSTSLGIGIWMVACRPSPQWVLPASIVALAIGVRVLTATAFDAPLAGENAAIHQQAMDILSGQTNCCFGHRPMGYPLALAGMYSLFGVGHTAIEILNIACGAVTTWLVFDIGRVGWSRSVGGIAAGTYALVPSQILLTLPPLTEPLYAVTVTGAVRLAVARGARPLRTAAFVGLAVAVAQYVRATAVALLVPILVLPVLAGDSARRVLQKAALVVAAFGIAMLPVLSFNLTSHGDLSVSTSAYGGWSLYVGANQESGGRFNPEDSAVFASLPGSSAWERSERAGELGIDRITGDPAGFLGMQPRKFATLFRDESYAGLMAFAPAGSVAPVEAEVAELAGQVFYVPIVALATVAYAQERRNPRPVVLLIGMIVALVAATHVFLEVHSRYHAYLVPLLVVLAASGADAAFRMIRERVPGGGL